MIEMVDSDHAAGDAPGKLYGIVGALLTPFDGDGAVDGAALEREIGYMASHCDAISIAGAEVAEYRALSASARRDLTRESARLVDGRVPTMIGVSAPSLGETAELCELAAELGGTWSQVLLPNRTWGGEPTASEVVAFVEAVVASSPLPVVLYHNPGQGSDPSLDALVAACEVDGVVAVKDSSRNISRVLRLVEEIEKPGHAGYLATIQPLLTVLLAGGSGAMAPPPSTALGAAIRDAYRAGDLQRAADLQQLAAIFPGKWSGKHGLAPTMKAAMDAIGMPLGAPAAPYPPLSADDIAAIGEIVRAWPVTTPTTAP
ncbi:MAG TPA: dihydrodipicolinate synthase family protein [Conexibacter sp.]|jgi:4-hydroxy-tetrahydrodipicolinate synthase